MQPSFRHTSARIGIQLSTMGTFLLATFRLSYSRDACVESTETNPDTGLPIRRRTCVFTGWPDYEEEPKRLAPMMTASYRNGHLADPHFGNPHRCLGGQRHCDPCCPSRNASAQTRRILVRRSCT